MDGNASNPKVKVVLVGAEGTGKTALARRFCKNEFSETGKDFVEEDTRTYGGVDFEVWDTAQYRDADAVLVVIDLTSPGSIAKARTIVVELRQSAEDSLLIGLVSNKSDQLAEEITEAEAHNLAREERLISFDCSAKTGQGVEEIFANLAKRLSSPAPAVSSSALRKPRIPSTRGVSPNPASPPPAPHAPSTMQSSAYATGGLPAVPASQKAQNETYFASMGSANNSRPADLPPSEGGRYSGFGSGGDSSFNPSSATSSRALPTYDDLREDPAGALGRGWNLFSSALGSAGRAVNESVVQPTLERAVDPTLQSTFSSYFSTAGEAISTASRRGGEALASGLQSSGEVIRRDLGYDVGDLGAGALERLTGRGAGEGYGRIGSSSAPSGGGEADELERGASDMSSTSSSRNETPVGSYREDSPAPNLTPNNRTTLPPRNGPPRSEIRRGSAQKEGEEEWGKEW